MRVCVVAGDKGGCGSYRMIWPAQALQEQGFDIHISEPSEASTLRADEFDVVVIQRPLRQKMFEHIQVMQAAGIAVVVDMDDDFSCIHPRNTNYRAFHPKFNKTSNWNILKRSCALADLVTVTTPALAKRYGGHGRVAVLPNYVPAWYLNVQGRRNVNVTVGWSGSIETHPDDLEVTRGAIANVLSDTGATFRAVGTGVGVGQALGFDKDPDATGWENIQGAYQKSVASLDIGIVPLADNQFNQAKSWLKGLEFAALGVPFVGSVTEPYSALYTLGIGQPAKRPREWRTKLQYLINNEGARVEQAANARQAARELTIQKNAWRWAEAWQAALDNRRAKVAA